MKDLTKFSIFILLLFASTFLSAEIKLPVIFSDGIVLQRDTKLNISGWATPGEKVVLTFNGKKYNTKTGKDGKWNIEIPAQKAGGPHEMAFKGTNEIKVNNILFGDVWLCAGQSNMVLPMERVKEKYPGEIATANYPEIRNFFIPTSTNLNGPQEDLPPGTWKEANPKDVLTFGAVAYFFAKKVYEKYKIPIGLINASVGGTPIEAWISEQGFQNFPEILKTIGQNKDSVYLSTLKSASEIFKPKPLQDKGMLESPKWFDESYIPKGWNNINIPGYWEDQGVKDLNGVVWFRKEIDVPVSMTGVPAKLMMGRIVDADFVYINGKQVGNITYQYPPRRYEIPAGVLKPGKNTIVIRVQNNSGKGGFVPDKPYFLTAGNQKTDLKGTWQYKVGEVYKPGQADVNPAFSAQNQPAALYNAMVAPLIQQKIKGFLWYQGESNAGNPEPYSDYLSALINDWRNKWNNENLPFLYVQLANFQDVDYLPTESNWAELRFAQLEALSVPNTAMTVTIDLGEWNDIHPLNKKDVGERLALGAFKLAYRENLVYSGPIYDSYKKDGNKIIVTFNEVGSGLISNDGEELRRFEIAGSDGKFVWANAKIAGNTIEVWSDEIEHPVKVRYAWADNPRDANLYNAEGLPASPFETKD
ncbi:MAG TPA: sialate O-acetylesterase [Draconibacterium sp.]|nr:sialate O-acetylesterase [Draconibacterium sp.]